MYHNNKHPLPRIYARPQSRVRSGHITQQRLSAAPRYQLLPIHIYKLETQNRKYTSLTQAALASAASKDRLISSNQSTHTLALYSTYSSGLLYLCARGARVLVISQHTPKRASRSDVRHATHMHVNSSHTHTGRASWPCVCVCVRFLTWRALCFENVGQATHKETHGICACDGHAGEVAKQQARSGEAHIE